VVGVLLHKDNKALFNLGAAQNFSIALERCISEILQGIQFEQIDDVMKPVVPLHTPIDDNVYSSMEKQLQHQYFSNLICGQGVVPPVVLDHSEPFNVAFLHDSNDLASDEACFIMLKTAKDQELEVYCRDVSFLGFDTYRLYIPGMSEVMMPSLDVIECLTTNLPKARKIFFNLSEATKQEVEFLAQQIEFLNDSPMLQKAGIIETLCGLTFDREAALYTMAPEIVVTLLYYSIGEINRAHESLERYLVHSAQPLSKNDSSVTIQQAIMEHFPDQACLLSFLFFLKENKSIEEISHILKDHYSPEAIASVSSMFTDNEGILSYLNIPNCKDCSVCDYQNICCFPRWQKIFNNFKKTISEKQYDSIAALQKYVI
jgi:ribosomal protein S12 methylthiotransferase accessory factor